MSQLVKEVFTAAKTRPPEESSHLRFMWSSPCLAPVTTVAGALQESRLAPSACTLQ